LSAQQKVRQKVLDRTTSYIQPTYSLPYSLPEQLRQPDITFGQFKRSLKTFKFGYLGRGATCLNVKGTD